MAYNVNEHETAVTATVDGEPPPDTLWPDLRGAVELPKLPRSHNSRADPWSAQVAPDSLLRRQLTPYDPRPISAQREDHARHRARRGLGLAMAAALAEAATES